MKIICDFDGTTAKNDVGNLLFRTFGDERCYEIVQAWRAGRINSKECLLQECAIANIDRQQLTEFALSQELDDHFGAFVGYCRNHNIEVEIASDGLDFYIEQILKKYDLSSEVGVRANHLVFNGGSSITAEFPYFEYGCGQCGNCKGYHVAQAQKTHDHVIYVGDGLSDRCGAKAADTVYAKEGCDLYFFCREHGIDYLPYHSFKDVLERLKHLAK